MNDPPLLLPGVMLLAFSLVCATSAQPVEVSHAGWTLKAAPAAATLVIENSELGTVLTNVQLQVLTEGGLRRIESWQVSQSESNLVIKSAQPLCSWRFEAHAGRLRISCTAPQAWLSARVPADGRWPVRLLDREGLQVEWTGTEEVAAGYGGSMTRNPSFLPRRNPECMYFALGNVSAGVFHCLFDRATDTAIDLPEQAQLTTTGDNPTELTINLPFTGSVEIRLLPDYFTKTLGVPFYLPFDERPFPRPPAVWCSWTSYYGAVSEKEVVRNTDWLAEHLKPYGFQYVQIDDGYDRGLKEGHYWIEHWDSAKFPHGAAWLAGYIKAKGLHPGLWLVPNAYAGAVQSHPEWYLRDNNDKIIRDYGTPALDSTNPAVLDFLKQLFSTLDGWGFEYYKFDGEHALPKYVPGVDRSKLHDKNVDPILAYRRRLEVIRSILGPERFVEGCPAGTPLNGIGFFNSYFNGQDLYNNWQGMYALFSSINANAFLNRIVVYVMPGEGMELGERISVEQARQKRPAEVIDTARSREEPMIGFGVTLAEARTLVSLVALSGVVYPLAGVMPELPPERLTLLQRTLPPMPIRPMDLFSRGNDIQWDTFKHTTADDYIHHYPGIVDLKVNAASGFYDVIALPNWRSAPVVKHLAFVDKLGLDGHRDYVAFDFWNQKLLGVFRTDMQLEIPGHDTRVVLLHPLLGRPQFIASSRHITGAFSVQHLDWNASQSLLSGASDTVAGQEYSLFFYVPVKAARAKAEIRSKDGGVIPAHLQHRGNLLSVSWPGTGGTDSWHIKFAPSQK